MARSRFNIICLAVLLAVALALGVAHRAIACPHGDSDAASCCDGMDQAAIGEPGVQHAPQTQLDAAMAPGCLHTSCLAAGHCSCGQPVSVVLVTARADRSTALPSSAVPVWPGSLLAAGRIPPARGPPDTGVPVPAGRHTYLATLRLRI